MGNKLMYIPNVYTLKTASVDYSQWLKRLDTELKESANQNSNSKAVRPTNKTYYKTLGTSVIDIPISPYFLPHYRV